MKRAILFISLLAFLPSFAFACSEASVKDCTIEVRIHVALMGQGASDDFARRLEGAAESAWNKGFRVGECACEFKVDVITKKVDDCDEAYNMNPSYFCFTVHNTSGVHRSNAFRSDFTKSLSSSVASTASGPGQLEAHDSNNTIAHEVGHLMGLHDEYSDKYKYWVVDSQRNKLSGPHFIDPEEWYNTGNSIKGSLPSGQALEFEAGGYRGLLHPVVNSGVENDSLMAYVGQGASVKQRHADAIFGQTALKCPDICCCGNGKTESSKNEECDPKASPNGCATYYSCDSCKCKATFICGDGRVSGPEECDHKANISSCGSDEDCSNDCACIKKPKPPQTDGRNASAVNPPPATTLTFFIANPPDNSLIGTSEPVIITYSDPGRVLIIQYFIDNLLIYKSQDPYHVFEIQPQYFKPGDHVFMVRVNDLEWNEAIQAINISIG